MTIFKIFKPVPAGFGPGHGSFNVFQQNMPLFQPDQHFGAYEHPPLAWLRRVLSQPVPHQTAAQGRSVGAARGQAGAFFLAAPRAGASGKKQIKQMPAFLAAGRHVVAAHDA